MTAVRETTIQKFTDWPRSEDYAEYVSSFYPNPVYTLYMKDGYLVTTNKPDTNRVRTVHHKGERIYHVMINSEFTLKEILRNHK